MAAQDPRLHRARQPDERVQRGPSIYERAQLLKDFPLAGHAHRSSSNRDLRTLLWGHYRIVYLVRPDEVHIVGVFHGAMRIENYLK